MLSPSCGGSLSRHCRVPTPFDLSARRTPEAEESGTQSLVEYGGVWPLLTALQTPYGTHTYFQKRRTPARRAR